VPSCCVPKESFKIENTLLMVLVQLSNNNYTSVFSYYASIMLYAFGYQLWFKLCQHNWAGPNHNTLHPLGCNLISILVLTGCFYRLIMVIYPIYFAAKVWLIINRLELHMYSLLHSLSLNQAYYAQNYEYYALW